jgi:hypothetical protein
VVYGFGRIDVSGRVGDQAIVSVLGWQPGDRLTLTAAAGVVIARRDPGGLVTMPVKPYLAIRRRCGTGAGCGRRPGPASRVPGRGRAGRVLIRGGGPGAAGARPVRARCGR